MIEKDRRRDTPRYCLDIKVRSSDRGLASGLHQGQRLYAPRTKAGHMTATCNDQNQLKSNLAKQGPSTHDSANVRFEPKVTDAAMLTFWRKVRKSDIILQYGVPLRTLTYGQNTAARPLQSRRFCAAQHHRWWQIALTTASLQLSLKAFNQTKPFFLRAKKSSKTAQTDKAKLQMK